MVKLNYLLSLFGLLTLCSFVSAVKYQGECLELRDLIYEDESNSVSFEDCDMNENGNIISLNLKGDNITQYVIDQIVNYKTIQELEFTRLGEISNINLESLHLSKLHFYDLKYGRKINKFRGNSISPDVIKTLKNIDIVSIIGYQISQETIDALSLTNAQRIYLNECGFDANLDFTKLKNVKNLVSLNLDNYGKAQALGEFSESLCQVKQLKELKIMSDITTIPTCINKLKKLEKLDLSYNDIKEIPNEIDDLTKLKYLDLSSIKLTSIPTAFKNLYRLETLVLGLNEITEVSSTICKLDRLKVLHLGYNNISKVSSCIQNLSKLQELVVNSNKLTTIPSGIYKLKSLETLDVSYNAITKVSSNIKNLKNIKYLELSNNEITDIQSAIGKLSKLETLYLNSNKINATIPESLNNLQELQSLNLNYNVDIRGKTLTNPKLDYCHYNIRDNATKDGICESENAVCKSDEDIPKC